MTEPARQGIPLRPDYSARPRQGDAIVRAILAHAHAFLKRDAPPEAHAKRLFGEDRTTEIVCRAASAPATATTSGWASTLAQTATLDLISTLGPASAASELIARSLQVSFERNYQITVPAVVSSASDVAFTAEGAPLPVRQLGIGGTTLTPHKAGAIFTFTRELLEHSTPNAEKLTRAVLTESVGLALDAVMLDANAASATRPAGLRNGVVGLAAATGGGDFAMIDDITALAAAVAGVVFDDGSSANVGTATAFHCTNFSGVQENVRIVTRSQGGALSKNFFFTLDHLSTQGASTHSVSSYVSLNMGKGFIPEGTAAIAATSTNIICTAMVLDAANPKPNGLALRGIRFNPVPGSQE